MSDEMITAIFVVLIAAFIFVVGCAAGHKVTKDSYHQAAIEAGVARWTVDPTSGATSFEYIKCDGGKK